MSPKLTAFAVLLVVCALRMSAVAKVSNEDCEFLSLGAGYYCCFEKLCCHAMVNAHRCNKAYNTEKKQFIVTPPEAALEVQCERSFKREDQTQVCCLPPVDTGSDLDHCYCPAPRRWCQPEDSSEESNES